MIAPPPDNYGVRININICASKKASTTRRKPVGVFANKMRGFFFDGTNNRKKRTIFFVDLPGASAVHTPTHTYVEGTFTRRASSYCARGFVLTARQRLAIFYRFALISSAQIPANDDSFMWWYSEWGVRGWSVLGRVLLIGSSVFIGLSSWLVG